jgi:hypothetical protein
MVFQVMALYIFASPAVGGSMLVQNIGIIIHTTQQHNPDHYQKTIYMFIVAQCVVTVAFIPHQAL